MAQARQQEEEYQAAMVSCLAGYGVKGIESVGGTVGTGGVTDANGNLDPGLEKLNEQASTACNAQVPAPDLWTAPLDDAAYQRMLDVRQCVIAHGYPVPEAPSEETWKEQQGPWNPYQVLMDPQITPQAQQPHIGEYEALMKACPQSGAGIYSLVPPDAFSS